MYSCGDGFVTMSMIPSWYEQQSGNSSTVPSRLQPNHDLNKKVSMFVGDITTLEIDAIVSASNTYLLGGFGRNVDNAIFSAAGRDLLQAECQTLDGCNIGDAKITGGYKLPAKCELKFDLIN